MRQEQQSETTSGRSETLRILTTEGGRKRFGRIGFTTAVVLALVAMVQAQAAQQSNSAYWVYDKVVSVETAESVIKITDAKGKKTRRITLTPYTLIMVNNKPGKLEDIKGGMWVEVTCTSGNLASRINVMDPRAGADAPVEKAAKPTSKGSPYYKVESVNTGDSTITVAEMDGRSITYAVTAGTKITVYGNPGKLEDIKKDMKVDVSATVGKMAGRIDAMDPPIAKANTPIRISKNDQSKQAQTATPLYFYEKVLSVNSTDFTLTVMRSDGQNRRTVTVTTFTQIKIYDKPGKLQDIKDGMKVDITCTAGNVANRIDAMDPPVETNPPPAKTN